MRPTAPLLLALVLSLATNAFAETVAPSGAAPAPEKEPSWIFELVPRAFARNPRFDFTVITEFTDAGKKRPSATPEAPVYYALHSSGRIAKGEPVASKPIAPEEVERTLRHSLRQAGFLPSTGAHPPELLIVYYWGFHGLINPVSAGADPSLLRRNVYDRALLVGGEKFARELVDVTERTVAIAAASAPPLGRGSDPESMDLGAAAGLAVMNAQMNPLKIFLANARNESLVELATDDCFFIVASAFDYRSAATPKKTLLWRTHLTASARDAAEAEVLPVMLGAAGPYLGRDMAEAAILSKRMVRNGKVDIGAPQIVSPSQDAKPK